MEGHLADLITCAKFQGDYFHGLQFYRGFLPFLYCGVTVDAEAGMYDCPQSALRPRTVWPNAPATPEVSKLVCEWVVCDSARGRCVLCRRDLVAIYFIVPGIGRYVSQDVD